MSGSEFIQKVLRLRRLIALQASLRWALRSLWVGCAAGLSAWGIHQLSGALSSPAAWVLIAIAAGLVPLAGIYFSRPAPQRLVWSLDRAFEHKQQVSTAWQEAHRPHPDPLAQLLISEAGALVDGLERRFRRAGWFLARDGISLLIVLILGASAAANAGFLSNPPAALDLAAVEPLPPPYSEPKQAALEPQPPEESAQPAPTAAQPPLTGEDLMALMTAAQEMGSAFAQIPETAGLGAALQQMDIQQAAAELEQMAQASGELPAETKAQMADAMQPGVEALAESSLGEVAQSLQQAQSALEQGDSADAADSLDALVGSLQQLSGRLEQAQQAEAAQEGEEAAPGGAVTAGDASGQREQGSAQEFTRLQGEGDVFELSGGSETGEIPGALKPGEPTAAGSAGQTASGALDAAAPANFEAGQGVIVPYSFGWNWKNVVSRYFQPIQ